MPVIGEDELKKQIKSCTFISPYLIYGDEEYVKKYYVNKIAQTAVSKKFAEFNLRTLDGNGLSIEELEMAVDVMPMLCDYTCTIIKDMQIDSLTAKDKENFDGLIAEVPSTSVVVFWMDKVDVKPGKSAKWKKIISQFEKSGCVVQLDKRPASSLKKFVVSGAKKRNCEISPNNAQYLVECVGDDMTRLLNELEKVCAYVHQGEIKKSDIDAVAIKSVEAVVFDLVKAINASNVDKAFTILSRLFAQKTEPVIILGTIINSYVDMYRAKLFQKSGYRPEDAAKFFDYKNKEFKLRNAIKNSSGMSLADLRECLDVLAQADDLLKSSGVNAKTIIEQCIVKVIIISNR